MIILVLAKTEAKEEPTTTTTAPTHTTQNNEVKTIDDKPREETVKAESSSASSYLTKERYDKNNNVNPFVTGTEFWQNIMTYWLNAYGEFLKNAPKMSEYWYDTYWKLG